MTFSVKYLVYKVMGHVPSLLREGACLKIAIKVKIKLTNGLTQHFDVLEEMDGI